MKARRQPAAIGMFALASAMFLAGVSPQARLIGLYSFNGTLADSSGYGKTAKDSGAATYVSGAPFGGKAISFDGSGKATVTVPLNISVAAMPQVTFGAWVDAKSVANPQYGVISNDDGNYDRTLDIDKRTATPGTNWSAFVGGTVVGSVHAVTGKWTFIAVSYDQRSGPGTYAFYTNDGVQTTVLTGKDHFDPNSVTTGVSIGKNPKHDQPFKGNVANAFFYKGILTRTQIYSIIAKGPSAIPGYRR